MAVRHGEFLAAILKIAVRRGEKSLPIPLKPSAMAICLPRFRCDRSPWRIASRHAVKPF